MSTVINTAAVNYVNNVEAWCKDYLYGTKSCTYTLDELWGQLMLLMATSNPCLSTTPIQMQCFLSLMQQPQC